MHVYACIYMYMKDFFNLPFLHKSLLGINNYLVEGVV